MDMTIGLL